MRFIPVLALLVLATPALAQQADPSATTEKPAAKKDDPNRQICRRTGQTGSILGGKPECHTKAEWEKLARAASDNWANRNSNAAPAN